MGSTGEIEAESEWRKESKWIDIITECKSLLDICYLHFRNGLMDFSVRFLDTFIRVNGKVIYYLKKVYIRHSSNLYKNT